MTATVSNLIVGRLWRKAMVRVCLAHFAEF